MEFGSVTEIVGNVVFGVVMVSAIVVLYRFVTPVSCENEPVDPPTVTTGDSSETGE